MKKYQSRRNERHARVAQNIIRIAYALAVIAALTYFLFAPVTVSSTQQITATSTEPVPLPEPAPKPSYTPKEIDDWKQAHEADVATKLADRFTPADARIALAILKQESNLNVRAQNFNCWYAPDGTVHETKSAGDKSRPCHKEDRALTWSVDCGIAQANFPALKTCPEYTLTLDWGIERMAKMHAERGFSPWVAYTSGLYIPFLD